MADEDLAGVDTYSSSPFASSYGDPEVRHIALSRFKRRAQKRNPESTSNHIFLSALKKGKPEESEALPATLLGSLWVPT